jgi:phage shock protein C
MHQRLTKSSTDKVVDGVAGGIAEYFAVDPVLVRLVFVLLFVMSAGTLVLLYIALMIIMPTEEQTSQSAVRVMRANVETFGDRVRAAGEELGGGNPEAEAPGEEPTEAGQASNPVESWQAQVERAARAAETPHTPKERSRQLGILLVVVGAMFLAQQLVRVDTGLVAAGALVAIGVAMLVRRSGAAK